MRTFFHHGDTEARRRRRGLENHAEHSFAEDGDVEVEEEADFAAAQFEIREQLGFVDVG
jgi:hypothetical protein